MTAEIKTSEIGKINTSLYLYLLQCTYIHASDKKNNISL